MTLFLLSVFLMQDIVIQQDDEIRLRIVGTRVDAKDIVSLVIILLIVVNNGQVLSSCS